MEFVCSVSVCAARGLAIDQQLWHNRFMPKGPKGQKRPADVIGCAIKVAKIATGEVEEDTTEKAYTRKAGKIGGKVRAEKLS